MTCPNIKNGYYKEKFRYLKKHFNEPCFRYYGVQFAKVKDPQNYGVVTFKGDRIISIIEKPKRPNSNYVNTGLWMFLPDVFAHLKQLKKSPRGEYEITDILASYVKQGLLTYSILKSTWTDAGSFDSLYKATVLMRRIEEHSLES